MFIEEENQESTEETDHLVNHDEEFLASLNKVSPQNSSHITLSQRCLWFVDVLAEINFCSTHLPYSILEGFFNYVYKYTHVCVCVCYLISHVCVCVI